MADEPNETPAPLSDAEIAAIGERAAQATPGPWVATYDRYVSTRDTARAYQREGDAGDVHLGDVARAEERVDGIFIAAARTDIPRLLATLAARDARLAALERENAALREIMAAVADRGGECWNAGDNVCIYCAARSPAAITGLEDDAIQHGAHCPVTRARALLATQPPATGDATGGEEGEPS